MTRVGRNTDADDPADIVGRRAGVGVVTAPDVLRRSNIAPEYGIIPALTGQSTLPAVTKFKPQDYQTPIGYWFLTQRTSSDRRPRPVGVF